MYGVPYVYIIVLHAFCHHPAKLCQNVKIIISMYFQLFYSSINSRFMSLLPILNNLLQLLNNNSVTYSAGAQFEYIY